MLKYNLAPPHLLITTFSSNSPWTYTTYNFLVNKIVTFTFGRRVLVLIFTLTWILISLRSSIFFLYDKCTKLLLVKITEKILDLFCVTHVWLVSQKSFVTMKHVNYSLHWNTYIVKYYNFFRRISVDSIENFQQHRGVVWSLREWTCWKRRRVLPNFLFVNQNRVFRKWTHLKIVKSWREKWIFMPGWTTASMFKSASSRWNTLSSRSDNWYPLVSMSFAPSLGSTSSPILIVLYWFGVSGVRARWLSKNSCFYDNIKLQAARGI